MTYEAGETDDTTISFLINATPFSQRTFLCHLQRQCTKSDQSSVIFNEIVMFYVVGML